MKKILSKKKLQLRATTIANLTGPNLERVIGGVTGPTDGAGITSRWDTGGHVVCDIPLTDGLSCPGGGPGQSQALGCTGQNTIP